MQDSLRKSAWFMCTVITLDWLIYVCCSEDFKPELLSWYPLRSHGKDCWKNNAWVGMHTHIGVKGNRSIQCIPLFYGLHKYLHLYHRLFKSSHWPYFFLILLHLIIHRERCLNMLDELMKADVLSECIFASEKISFAVNSLL